MGTRSFLYLFNNKAKEDMKAFTAILLILITLTGFSQTLPEMVEKNIQTELAGTKSKNSKVDLNNIDQLTLHNLIVSKIRKEQILRNPLLLFTGKKLNNNLSTFKAAKHHTLYQSINNRLTHKEKNDSFESIDYRYDFYNETVNDESFVSGEVCTTFKGYDNLTYNKMAALIVSNYIHSNGHKQALMAHAFKGDFMGTYVSVSKNGSVYNTIVFATTL